MAWLLSGLYLRTEAIVTRTPILVVNASVTVCVESLPPAMGTFGYCFLLANQFCVFRLHRLGSHVVPTGDRRS